MTGSIFLRVTLCLAAGLLTGSLTGNLTGRARAADDTLTAEATPEVRTVVSNANLLYDRLKLAFSLTTSQEQEQYARLKQDMIDVFLVGIDPKRPVRVDFLTGGPKTSYVLFVPIANFNDFWKNNLDPSGIPVRSFPNAPGLFKLGGGANDAFDGLMRYSANEREGYAAIAEDINNLPADMPKPVGAVQPLLKAGYDMALQLVNQPGNVDARHKHYHRERERLLDKLKRDAGEMAADFALRKEMAAVQFDETERLYAESQRLLLGLSSDAKGPTGTSQVRLEPLPETSLAESVAQIGTKASRFAGIPRGDKVATTGRINFPIDDFRKKNFTGLTKVIRQRELDALAASEATAEQKQAGQQFINGFFDRIQEGLDSGAFDGFVEMTQATGSAYTVVGGFAFPDGRKWGPMMELLPKTRQAIAVKMNVGTHEGVTLHELTLTQASHAEFINLFGGGRLLAGTSEDAVWYAAGPEAEAKLKQAITQAKTAGKPDMTFVSFRGQLLPWFRTLGRIIGEPGKDGVRDMAVAAFTEQEGVATLELMRDGTAVTGTGTIDRGVFRLVGKLLADFTAKNL